MRIGVGLSIPELATRGGRFSPASLFTGGVQGAWYAPDDFSTLFQDSAGTTPVTAVEQPVGLMLDKSQGLVLGTDGLNGAGSFTSSTGWSLGAGWTIGSGSATAVNAGNASYTSVFTVGVWYKITVDVTSYTSGTLYAGTISNSPAFPTGTGTKTIYVLADATTFYLKGLAAFNGVIDNLVAQPVAGNHASQATAASRPVLRARYNLLTYSEQFDNAAYTKSSVTLTTNATTAPDGTTTAEKVLATAGNARHAVYPSGVTASGTCVASIYVKYDNHAFFQIGGSSGGFYANFNVQTGVVGTSGGARYLSHAITSVGSGWYRLSVTYTNSSDGPWFQQVSSASDGLLPFWTAAGTESTFIWGAQVDNASSIGTYQRIAAATDYATAGFLPYLALDGTDDSFGTNSIDFSATDKMFVCVGITKLSDAVSGTVIDQNGVVGTAAFMMRAPSGAVANYAFFSGGTTGFSGAIALGYAAPTTNVVSGIGNISGDQEILRVNGAQVAISTVDQGTGNYSNLPIYIGRRQGTQLPLNGRIYQMVVCGKTLSASELASTEAYVNSKTGAY